MLKLILLLTLLFFPNISYSKTGKGELKLSKEIMEYVMMYMYGAGNKKFSADKKRKNDPSLMAVSKDGKSAYYYYCPAEYRAYGCIDSNTTNKAKRDNVRPLSSLNLPLKRARLPHKIMAKNGIVMDKTSSIAC